MRRRFAFLVAAGLLLGATGCAVTKDPRQNLLEGTTSQAVYKLPPESLLATARELLVEEGYELLPSSDPLYLHTTWRIRGNVDVGASWSRILVQAHRLDNGRTMIRAYRMAYTTNGRAPSHPGSFAGQREAKENKGGGGGSSQAGVYVLGEPLSPTKPTLLRATDFEWALLSRVEPQFAAHLKSRVDAYLTEQKQQQQEAAKEGKP
ncbi:hypothetical protein HPC49_29140 [Pyxidicoccus fallax]|uniref:Lipoprotein n=1 Tax=Pyxidicoccus fallax TaxID=394095 RepID=A0A848LB89_9BACT|nr:hypothetical protein [Pyxidicoccus fallax]NMO16320.1 hypothetical protein [Pyxidicoccus fallax]NPC82271.1 hypothetical protein [Pyxidicoccus fallax]